MEGFRFVDERENEELREVIPQQLEKVSEIFVWTKGKFFLVS